MWHDPQNIETRHVKTYRSSDNESGFVSMELNNSMISSNQSHSSQEDIISNQSYVYEEQEDYHNNQLSHFHNISTSEEEDPWYQLGVKTPTPSTNQDTLIHKC